MLPSNAVSLVERPSIDVIKFTESMPDHAAAIIGQFRLCRGIRLSVYTGLGRRAGPDPKPSDLGGTGTTT